MFCLLKIPIHLIQFETSPLLDGRSHNLPPTYSEVALDLSLGARRNRARAKITATDKVFSHRLDMVGNAGFDSGWRPDFSYRSSEGRNCEDILEDRAGLRWNEKCDQSEGRLLALDMERAEEGKVQTVNRKRCIKSQRLEFRKSVRM